MSFERVVRIVALCAIVPFLVTACGKSSGGNKAAHVRFVNGLFGAAPINITVDTNNVQTGLAFEGTTNYLDIDSGTREFKVGISGGTSTIIDVNQNIGGDQFYTYLIYGTSSAPSAQLVSDTINVTQPGSGQYLLRVTNAAFGNAGLDVYVTAPGASIDGASPNLTNITYNGSSSLIQLASGSQQVRMTLRNSKQVIYDSGTVTFNEKSSYYLVAYTKGSGTLVGAINLNLDAATGAGVVVPSKLAQLKVVHGALGTAGINALVNGAVTFANIPFQGSTSYTGVNAGTQTVRIEAVTSPGAAIATATPAFAASTDTSVIVAGPPGAQKAIVLSDNNLPGSVGAARIRFANVSPDAGSVDVLVNFAKQVSALTTNGASGYIELTEDTYSINFDQAGTTNVVLSLPAVALTKGKTYTLYLVGQGGQLSGVLSRDF